MGHPPLPAQRPTGKPKPTAPLVSVQFDCPNYLDEELAVRAAGTRGPSGGKVTKNLILVPIALRQTALHSDDIDLIEDHTEIGNKATRHLVHVFAGILTPQRRDAPRRRDMARQIGILLRIY